MICDFIAEKESQSCLKWKKGNSNATGNDCHATNVLLLINLRVTHYFIIGSDRFTRLNQSISKEKISIDKQCLHIHLLVKQSVFLII